jgi:hypothetical protein
VPALEGNAENQPRALAGDFTIRNPERLMFYLSIVDLARRVLAKAVDRMGIQVPQRM